MSAFVTETETWFSEICFNKSKSFYRYGVFLFLFCTLNIMSMGTQLFIKSTRPININKGFFARLFRTRTFFYQSNQTRFQTETVANISNCSRHQCTYVRNIRRCNYRLSYIFLITITNNIGTHNLFGVSKHRRSLINYLIFVQFTIVPYLLNTFEVREKIK